MDPETAMIIHDRESSRLWESPLKKPKTDDSSGKRTEQETTNVNVDEEQISDEVEDNGVGFWVDEETLRKRIEELDEKYDNFGYIDDEKLRDAARAYCQRLLANPFDIDDLPPSPIDDPFGGIWALDQRSWQWERVKELMQYAVETEQVKKGWKLSELNLVKVNQAQNHFYITFEAKHFPTDQENTTYQTSVYDGFVKPLGNGPIEVDIFRRKGEEDVGSAST